MDSPTLRSFDYQQFWYEAEKHFRMTLNILPFSAPIKTEAAEVKTKEKKPAKTGTSDTYKATKNVAKNYGKAISSFACSSLSTPYLIPLLKEHNLKLEDFSDYMQQAKRSIRGIDTFRNLLLINEDDDEQTVAKKLVFQKIGIKFIKYFSVNWIMHGRISNKMVYLKYRFKMLRRLQDPASFTYLQSPKVKKGGKDKN